MSKNRETLCVTGITWITTIQKWNKGKFSCWTYMCRPYWIIFCIRNTNNRNVGGIEFKNGKNFLQILVRREPLRAKKFSALAKKPGLRHRTPVLVSGKLQTPGVFGKDGSTVLQYHERNPYTRSIFRETIFYECSQKRKKSIHEVVFLWDIF